METREFLNAKKPVACHCSRTGQLFCQRVVSGHAETLYAYAVHPAVKGVSRRSRCYIGRASRYVTGRTCQCGRRIMAIAEVKCYQCRRVKA